MSGNIRFKMKRIPHTEVQTNAQDLMFEIAEQMQQFCEENYIPLLQTVKITDWQKLFGDNNPVYYL